MAFKQPMSYTLVVALAYTSTIATTVYGIAHFEHVKLGVGKVPVVVGTSTVATTTINPNNTTPVVTTQPKITPNSTIETGVGCGTKRMRSFDVVRIQSHDFGRTNYPNNDACTWKFIGRECTVSVECPCFDVPPSFQCFEDYLKIIDLPYYHQKFCGSLAPSGIYRASTDIFSIRFRSDKREAGKGFVCFVQCTPPGYADQQTPGRNETCPDLINYYE